MVVVCVVVVVAVVVCVIITVLRNWFSVVAVWLRCCCVCAKWGYLSQRMLLNSS